MSPSPRKRPSLSCRSATLINRGSACRCRSRHLLRPFVPGGRALCRRRLFWCFRPPLFLCYQEGDVRDSPPPAVRPRALRRQHPPGSPPLFASSPSLLELLSRSRVALSLAT